MHNTRHLILIMAIIASNEMWLAHFDKQREENYVWREVCIVVVPRSVMGTEVRNQKSTFLQLATDHIVLRCYVLLLKDINHWWVILQFGSIFVTCYLKLLSKFLSYPYLLLLTAKWEVISWIRKPYSFTYVIPPRTITGMLSYCRLC